MYFINNLHFLINFLNLYKMKNNHSKLIKIHLHLLKIQLFPIIIFLNKEFLSCIAY